MGIWLTGFAAGASCVGIAWLLVDVRRDDRARERAQRSRARQPDAVRWVDPDVYATRVSLQPDDVHHPDCLHYEWGPCNCAAIEQRNRKE